MTRVVVVDTSALAAVVFDEPEAEDVDRRLQGAMLFAPIFLKYELANVAWVKTRRHPAMARKIMKALAAVLDDRWNIAWKDVDLSDAVLIGHSINVSPYDAAFLWLAGIMQAELVTLDRQLVKASAALAEEQGN